MFQGGWKGPQPNANENLEIKVMLCNIKFIRVRMSDIRIKPIWWRPVVERKEWKGINEDRCHLDEVCLENHSQGSKWTVAGRKRTKEGQAEVLEQ